MDFLLNFRFFKSKEHVAKPPKSETLSFLHTDKTTFLLVPIENKVWKYCQLFAFCLRYVITTYTIAFYPDEKRINLIDFVNLALDIVYLVDVICALVYRIRCPKAKRHLRENANLLSQFVWRNALYRPRKIWMLVIDIFSLIPFEVFRFVLQPNSFYHAAIHCTPTLRIYRLFAFYVEEFKTISLRTHVLIELIVKVAIIWILTSHTFTCLWGLLAGWGNQFELGSLPDLINFQNQRPFEWYLVIFYFIQIEFTNIGFGDIVPTSEQERVLAIIVILVGFILLCGYFIAALSSVLTEKARRLSSLHHRLSLIIKELEQRRVPDLISKKIMKFYYSLWASRNGIGPVNNKLLSLPNSFVTLVYYDMFLPALNASLLFRSCDDFSKRAIARVMRVHLFMAGDVVLKRREINSKMFYIRKGTIQIMSFQDDETEIMTFGAGTVFGQISLLLSHPAKSEVHAATFCEIHVLKRKNLFSLLSDYPKAREIVMNVHKNLLYNALADKYFVKSMTTKYIPENVLTTTEFYKIPVEASKLARDDICVVTTFPYVFMPDTIFLKTWNTMVAIIVLIICFYYPYCAAFTREYPQPQEPLIIIVDLVLFINLYLSFSTAFVRENILFSSLRDIAMAKLVSFHIYIDIFSLLPIHYILSNDNRLKPVILCLRCLNFYKINTIFRRVEYTASITLISILRLIKYVMYFLLGSYVIGMIYYMQACYYDPCLNNSWYVKFDIPKKIDSPIVTSLYFAILVVSGTGFGDITVASATDIAYVIGFSIVGVILFIYLIAEYSATLSLIREDRQNFVELGERVHSFLVSHKMLTSERIRVRQYLNLQWEKNKGYEFISEEDLFHDTPRHLLFEANQHSRGRGIYEMELFKGMGELILRQILAHAVIKLFPPHEVVIYAGEICNKLLIIEEGYCEATYGKDVSVKRILHAGQDIGTVELMLGLTSMCHVRTLTHCIITLVDKHQILRAFAINPVSAKELNDTISELKTTEMVQEYQRNKPIRLHLTVRSSIEKSVYRFRSYRRQGGNKELRNPYRRLGLCQFLRFILRSTTILPYGKLLKRWELSRCLFAFLSAMLFPCIPYFQLEYPFLYYFGIFLDCTAYVDLYFRAHVCYYNKRNLLVSHPLRTCSHYIKGSFVLDFICCFPFDRIMYRPLYDFNGETYVSYPSIDILRTLRVGQVYRIPSTINNLGVDFLSNPSLFWVLVMTIALTIVYINIFASFLTLTTLNFKTTKSGEYRAEFAPDVLFYFQKSLNKYNLPPTPVYIYLLNFYWVSSTAFGLGFGDITAESKELMIYVIVVIVISYLFFNYVTIVIASYLSSINMNLTVFQKRMSHLIFYLKSEKVDAMLSKHTINHFEYVWKKTKGVKAQMVFLNFNVALRDDVMLHLYEETIKGVNAFSNLDISFYRILSSKLDEAYFQTGASIYKPGDIISVVYIVHQGEITLVGKNEEETEVLSRSHIFGNLFNQIRGEVTLSAVATKNLTVLIIETLELYNLVAKLEAASENTSEAEKEKKKFEELLLKSNETKKEEVEEKTTNVFMNKSRLWFAYTAYVFSKHIMVLYVCLSLMSANKVVYDLAFQNYNLQMLFFVVPQELLFAFKIFLEFNTAYVNESGDLVSDLRLIKQRYMRITGFYLDLVTVIPLELLGLLAPHEDRIFIVTWLRIIKVLRLYNVWYFFNQRFDTLSVNIILLKIIAVGVWTGTLIHQCACIWYFIVCPRADCRKSVTWQEDKPWIFTNHYLNCVYFIVVVITTTGFGDITPHRLEELLFIVVLEFVAFFYTAIFIGQMVSTTQKSLFAKTNYEFEVEGLNTYLKVNDVSQETRKSIISYMENLWRNEKGQPVPELLVKAPPYLMSEIRYLTYGHHIDNNLLFRERSVNLRRHLAKALNRMIFFPGNIIAFEGDVSGTAYFVHSGQVESKKTSSSVTKIYIENSSFGLPHCFEKKLPYVCTYYSRTYSIILSLTLKNIQFLEKFFPEDFKNIRKELTTLEE